MRAAIPKIYRSFEEFEREEIRALDMSATVEGMLDEMFAEELDFDDDTPRGRRRRALSEG